MVAHDCWPNERDCVACLSAREAALEADLARAHEAADDTANELRRRIAELEKRNAKLDEHIARLLHQLEFVVNDPASTDAVRVRLVKVTLTGFRAALKVGAE